MIEVTSISPPKVKRVWLSSLIFVGAGVAIALVTKNVYWLSLASIIVVARYFCFRFGKSGLLIAALMLIAGILMGCGINMVTLHGRFKGPEQQLDNQIFWFIIAMLAGSVFGLRLFRITKKFR